MTRNLSSQEIWKWPNPLFKHIHGSGFLREPKHFQRTVPTAIVNIRQREMSREEESMKKQRTSKYKCGRSIWPAPEAVECIRLERRITGKYHTQFAPESPWLWRLRTRKILTEIETSIGKGSRTLRHPDSIANTQHTNIALKGPKRWMVRQTLMSLHATQSQWNKVQAEDGWPSRSPRECAQPKDYIQLELFVENRNV